MEREQIIQITKECGKAAADAMSKLTESQIELNRVNFVKQNVKGISEFLVDADRRVICSFFHIDGDLKGVMLFILFEDVVTGNPGLEMVNRNGSQVILTYLNAMSKYTSLHAEVTYAETVREMIGAIIQSVLADYVPDKDNVYLVEHEYVRDNGDKYYSMFFPEQEEVKILIDKIAKKL